MIFLSLQNANSLSRSLELLNFNEALSDVNTTLDGSTSPGWKLRCFGHAIFFRLIQNASGYIWDQCCHLQHDGASLRENEAKSSLIWFSKLHSFSRRGSWYKEYITRKSQIKSNNPYNILLIFRVRTRWSLKAESKWLPKCFKRSSKSSTYSYVPNFCLRHHIYLIFSQFNSISEWASTLQIRIELRTLHQIFWPSHLTSSSQWKF